MIATFGHLLLGGAFVAALAAMVLYAYAAVNDNKTVERISNWMWGVKGLLVFASSAALIWLIMTHQFQYYYVWNYTSLDLETKYLFSAFYGGQEGSFMLWICVRLWLASG
jgi:cytochrome c-type biogenesis protein CcmF